MTSSSATATKTSSTMRPASRSTCSASRAGLSSRQRRTGRPAASCAAADTFTSTTPCRSLFYYAHLRSLHVELGDIVSPGQAIATVGRSGRNAAQPRSPTHLHVMCLVIEGDAPRARDIYRDLLRLGRRRAGV
jgi:hypothetical protein